MCTPRTYIGIILIYVSLVFANTWVLELFKFLTLLRLLIQNKKLCKWLEKNRNPIPIAQFPLLCFPIHSNSYVTSFIKLEPNNTIKIASFIKLAAVSFDLSIHFHHIGLVKT